MFLSFLFGNHAKTSDKNFLKLCKHGSAQEISAALKDGANPNAKGKVYGYTALMNAAEQNKDPEVIRILINAGADVNDRDILGMTALMWAARSNDNPEVLNALLEAGADINDKDEKGTTALVYAVEDSKQPEVLAALLKAGADPNEDKYCMIRAAQRAKPNVKFFISLIDAGADVDAKDRNGGTALIYAAKNDVPEIIDVLLKAGADVNAKNGDGRTPLMEAVMNDAPYEILTMLLKAGADIHATDNDGKSAKTLATGEAKAVIWDVENFLKDPNEWIRTKNFVALCASGHVNGVKTMLKAGMKPDARDSLGCTGLMRASWRGHLDVVKVLLDAGADVNAQIKGDRTALMWAVDSTAYDGPEIVSMLINAGADVNAKALYGDTALDIAKTDLIRKILIKAGAKSGKL